MRLFLTVAASVLLVLPGPPAGAAELDSVTKDIVGVWQLDFIAPDDVRRTPTVIVGRQRDELVAWYIEKGKPVAFEDVCLKDDTVAATIKPKEYDGKLTVTLEAWLETDGACRGKAEYRFYDGESGNWEFSGKQIPLSKFDDVTQWDVAFSTPEYERHRGLVTLVSVGEKKYGWYSGREFELPIMEVKSGDEKLVMRITTETRDGAKVEVTFRGSVEGDRVTGEAEYQTGDDRGSFAFSGKLKS